MPLDPPSPVVKLSLSSVASQSYCGSPELFLKPTTAKVGSPAIAPAFRHSYPPTVPSAAKISPAAAKDGQRRRGEASAATNSRVLSNRSSGFFARERRIARSTRIGKSGTYFDGAAGTWLSFFACSSSTVLPLYGQRPVISSYSTAPRA